MKELVDNPRPPIELFRKDENGAPIRIIGRQGSYNGVFACGECGVIYANTEKEGFSYSILNCCKQPYCECGHKIEYTGYTVCSPCRDKSRIDKAEEVEDNGEAVTVFDDDEWFMSLDSLVEELHDRLEPDDYWPEWASPSESHVWSGISEWEIESMIESSLSDFYEEADEHIIDYQELIDFVKKWNQKQNIVSYQTITGKKVRIPPRPPIED